MARTKITVTALDPAGTTQPSAQNADATNGMYVDRPDAGGEFERVLLEVANGGASGITVTVKAGTSERDAVRHGLGDLAVSVPNGATKLIGPFESARFTQPDGDLYVDFSAATSVTLRAYRLPTVGGLGIAGTA